MNDKINTQMVMKEILEVLAKYSLPVKTVSLDISLLSKEFEELFPHLKTYKGGHFFKEQFVEGIPVAFTAKRRIPFDELVHWLRENVHPYLQNVVEEIEREFKEIQTHMRITHEQNNPKLLYSSYHCIEIDCRLRSEPTIEEHNTVVLSIGVSQMHETSYPILFGYVGWLVDRESGDDWGIEKVFDLNQLDLAVNESSLLTMIRDLPYLRQHLVNELTDLTTNIA